MTKLIIKGNLKTIEIHKGGLIFMNSHNIKTALNYNDILEIEWDKPKNYSLFERLFHGKKNQERAHLRFTTPAFPDGTEAYTIDVTGLDENYISNGIHLIKLKKKQYTELQQKRDEFRHLHGLDDDFTNECDTFDDEELNAIALVLDILQENGISAETINIARTNIYIKFTADRYYDFCRIKLDGNVRYMELTIWIQDAKRLRNDLRFEGLELGKKRFSRIPIDNCEDIEMFSDAIVLAYNWAVKK